MSTASLKDLKPASNACRPICCNYGCHLIMHFSCTGACNSVERLTFNTDTNKLHFLAFQFLRPVRYVGGVTGALAHCIYAKFFSSGKAAAVAIYTLRVFAAAAAALLLMLLLHHFAPGDSFSVASGGFFFISSWSGCLPSTC